MSEREEKYYEQLETLRMLMVAAHEAYNTAAQEYEFHIRRMTVLSSGGKHQRYLDGQNLENK